MDPVVHFEMGAKNRSRMRKFYESCFGWKTKQLGKEMGNYITVSTAKTDKNNMVKTPGTINGGFYQKTSDPSSFAPSIVIAVGNLEASMKKVVKAGGKVAHKEEIPGIGMWASFYDTEGNRVSMLQANRKDYPKK
ncbi:Uncharacterised protein [uncultured archaeon]|nr:Uncharacterised protein [uncultured archaeon]